MIARWRQALQTGEGRPQLSAALLPPLFASGWLDRGAGKYWGRPFDIIFANNRICISDDYCGSIYIVNWQ